MNDERGTPAVASLPPPVVALPRIAALSSIGLLFVLSGAAALIYQVCWQRLLFDGIGVDIDSVTIIVSTFMLGLGVGSLLGGELADRYPDRQVHLFALAELSTALFGFLSPYLIRSAAILFVSQSRATVVVLNFLLLLVPTTLMGLTLPLLVAHVVKVRKNLGDSVGILYFANTLGAALGAALTGFLALYYMGLTRTIDLAALLNVIVGATVWLGLRAARV